jgi:signal transduction histidine kinase
MVAMVLATLILSGLTSLALAQNAADSQTRKELVHEAQALATTFDREAAAANSNDPARALRNLLVALRAPLRLDGSAVVGLRPLTGGLFQPAAPRQAPALPAGLKAADLDPPALAQDETVSGKAGSVIFAAVPFSTEIQLGGAPRQVTLVIVLSRRPPSSLATAGPWFAVSAVVILAVAGLVAYRLGRRFVAPVRAAQEVTSRIAAGDLDARVPAPRGTDPELAGLADSVNAMAANLAQAKGAERQFLQSVSHELRTPLTSIRGFAEAIEDGATADATAAAAVIASEARRLERLVGDLLGLATFEARRFTLHIQPVDLSATLSAAAGAFAPSAGDLGVSLNVEGGQPVWVAADPDRLAQVVANLVENALRYARSSVTLVASAGPGGPQLQVSDDGPGIAPADLPHVFDRLFVARSAPQRNGSAPPKGSGLGLAIVAELVAAMGGAVRAESPTGPDGGTRMVVALRPAAALPPAAAGTASA